MDARTPTIREWKADDDGLIWPVNDFLFTDGQSLADEHNALVAYVLLVEQQRDEAMKLLDKFSSLMDNTLRDFKSAVSG